MSTLKRIHIIVNPASGGDKPVLSILNEAFHSSGIDWEVKITKETGDGRRLAEAALAEGVDVVGVYGGDGTVMEVASALVGKPTPLAIFPGGTANVMSVELGIPSDPLEACALVGNTSAVVRAIDVGQTGDQFFLTRVGLGIEAAAIEATDREQKNRMGWVAYALNLLRQMNDTQVSRYHMVLDGQPIETEGLMCMIANTGILSPNTAVPGSGPLRFAPNILVDDGLLDVIVIRRGDPASILAVAASVVAGNENAEPLLHWQGREITVEADPPQLVQLDGDVTGQSPLAARVLPRSLNVIVPGAAQPTIPQSIPVTESVNASDITQPIPTLRPANR
jgi:YegS/Rv2252/BmrU family lipid kinase